MTARTIHPTIVVAEDSLVVRAVLRRDLEAHGYVVIEADDGDAAVVACREGRPDAVLLDIEMPGLNGFQVLAALKADPELDDVPVVFLTGHTDTQDIVDGLRLGAHDYLKKPFEASELIARVSAAVRVKTLQDELKARNAELDRVGRTDALTGLANRRHIEELLRKAVSAARRNDDDLTTLMLDIDHFKLVNDTFGHAGGDEILCEFSSRLERTLRVEDTAGRWGGEEFLVVLPHTDLAAGVEVAERVRSCIAATPFPVGDGDLAVTVSVGCATGAECDTEDLIRRADEALYHAKEGGRNQVAAASSA